MDPKGLPSTGEAPRLAIVSVKIKRINPLKPLHKNGGAFHQNGDARPPRVGSICAQGKVTRTEPRFRASNPRATNPRRLRYGERRPRSRLRSLIRRALHGFSLEWRLGCISP